MLLLVDSTTQFGSMAKAHIKTEIMVQCWARILELEEVIWKLDKHTKHVGRPTRSPRRPTWVADSHHFSSDAR